MSDKKDLSNDIKENRQEEEIELLQELVGIDDPDEFEERKKDIEAEVDREAELLNILHKKAQNANLEHALYFESLKQRVTEDAKQLIGDADDDKEVEEKVSDYANKMVSIQLIINVLRENPDFNDIAMRLDKIEEFIELPTDEEDGDILADTEFEGGDFEFE